MLLEWVEQLNFHGLHDSISLTGGEPLLHAKFMIEFLPQLRTNTTLPVYLETGGHRPEQLATILPYLDSVGMDFKLQSTSGESRWEEHAKCLQLCHNAKLEVFVKIIVSQNTDLAELERSALLVAGVNPEIPVFLQPVTPLETSYIHECICTCSFPRPSFKLASFNEAVYQASTRYTSNAQNAQSTLIHVDC